MFRALTLAVVSALLAASANAQATIYFPILSPTSSNPWVLNQPNIFAWRCAGGTGLVSFDVQLHNSNRTVMNGYLDIALRVPMENLPTGYKNCGGEMEVDLTTGVPTGDGFTLILLDSLHGEVYAKSDKFSILTSTPSNYSTVTGLPTATVTATLGSDPNPTQQWAVTLNGPNADATATNTATVGAGNAGSGT